MRSLWGMSTTKAPSLHAFRLLRAWNMPARCQMEDIEHLKYLLQFLFQTLPIKKLARNLFHGRLHRRRNCKMCVQKLHTIQRIICYTKPHLVVCDAGESLLMPGINKPGVENLDKQFRWPLNIPVLLNLETLYHSISFSTYKQQSC